MNQPANFLDRKTIMAILLVGSCWLGWNFYMQKKYPDFYQRKSTAENQATPTTDDAATAPAAAPSPEDAVKAPDNSPGTLEQEVKSESVFPVDTPNFAFELSSKGMGLKNFVLKKYTDRAGKNVTFGEVDGVSSFATYLTGQTSPLDFEISQAGPLHYVGTAQSSGLTITKSFEIDPDKYLLKTKVHVAGTTKTFLGLTSRLVLKIEDQPKSSFFMPQYAKQEFFVISDGSKKRHITNKEAVIDEALPRVSIVALGDQYFSQALMDRSDIIPDTRLKSDIQTHIAWADVNYPSLGKTEGFTINYETFIGPKFLDLLDSINPNLAGVIDFGFFSWLAKHILHLMNWFHDHVSNWGLAIIFLTVFVRLLVMPLYLMSFRSMNKMKVIQPQIQSLRERHKDDPTKMNQEMMALMRTHKVNPLGGCLPLLLQFPVFIALYQVLGQSIELYQAPFFGWIHDLSLKDPYYIFPILMGITMFIQQKITPTTMDPAQAKVLAFMPIVFTFFMLGLPSGLTLYIFVSALFGIIQQLIFMKNDPTQNVTAKS